MKIAHKMFLGIGLAAAWVASAGNPTSSPPLKPLAVRPRQAVAPSTPEATSSAPGASTTARDPEAPSPDAPKFTSEARWELAGYNNDEVVYTVFVTSQDARIIRCTTEVKGFYFENGTKLSISDRQITTVFPNQPTRVGYWMDMDQQSGATYSVKCHPV
jgi:hypothetical protein